jgi:uncharacterized protein YlxW (UPF0749 family)
MDRLAKIWTFQNDKVEPLGILKQGYMLKQNYTWSFPLQKHAQQLSKRVDNVQTILDDLRKKRDDENNQKKKGHRSISNNRTAGGTGITKTTFGMAGATMMGFQSQGPNQTGY